MGDQRRTLSPEVTGTWTFVFREYKSRYLLHSWLSLSCHLVSFLPVGLLPLWFGNTDSLALHQSTLWFITTEPPPERHVLAFPCFCRLSWLESSTARGIKESLCLCRKHSLASNAMPNICLFLSSFFPFPSFCGCFSISRIRSAPCRIWTNQMEEEKLNQENSVLLNFLYFSICN